MLSSDSSIQRLRLNAEFALANESGEGRATELVILTVDPISGQSRGRTDIEQQIQQNHPNVMLMSSVLHHAPISTGNKRSFAEWVALCIPGVAVIIAMFSALASWGSAEAGKKSSEIAQQTAAQAAEDREKGKRESWQAAKVYEIIDESNKDSKDFKGLTFTEILTKYRSAALEPEVAVKIGKEEIQPYSLRRILVRLQESGLIGRTFDGNYVAQRSTMNTKEDILRSQAGTRMSFEIVKLLRKHGRAVTEEELARLLKEQFAELKMPWNNDDFLATIINLSSSNTIGIDGKGAIILSLKLPPK